MAKVKVTSPKEAMRPKEVIDNKIHVIHPDIITIVNEFLTKRYNGTLVKIAQDEIVNEFMKRNKGFKKEKLFADHHLDFELIFESKGWSVNYDQPGYCENYDAYFVFKPKKQK